MPVVRVTEHDLEQVREAWDAEALERSLLPSGDRPLVAHPRLSDAARSLKTVFDGVLYKHHPEGLPGSGDDFWEEP